MPPPPPPVSPWPQRAPWSFGSPSPAAAAAVPVLHVQLQSAVKRCLDLVAAHGAPALIQEMLLFYRNMCIHLQLDRDRYPTLDCSKFCAAHPLQLCCSSQPMLQKQPDFRHLVSLLSAAPDVTVKTVTYILLARWKQHLAPFMLPTPAGFRAVPKLSLPHAVAVLLRLPRFAAVAKTPEFTEIWSVDGQGLWCLKDAEEKEDDAWLQSFEVSGRKAIPPELLAWLRSFEASATHLQAAGLQYVVADAVTKAVLALVQPHLSTCACEMLALDLHPRSTHRITVHVQAVAAVNWLAAMDDSVDDGVISEPPDCCLPLCGGDY